MKTWIEKFRSARVLVVGDVMLDHYVRGRAERISPESPVPIVEVEGDEFHLGGAGNVAANVAAFASETTLIGVVGTDPSAGRLTILARDAGIDARLVRDPSRDTTVKTRVFAGQHQVARIDRESRRPVRNEIEFRVLEQLTSRDEYDVVIVQDYEKGVMTPAIRSAALLAEVPVAVDPKRLHFFDYGGATLFKPNWKELGDAFVGEAKPTEAWLDIAREKVGAKYLAVTLGANGIFVAGPHGLIHRRAEAREVFDVSGAGDTVLAIYGLALASGVDIVEATELANLAAGIVVSKPGTAVVDPGELASESLRPREAHEEALA